jgi:uncharacterized membrane protein YhaH (DUF805 family)
MHWYTDVLKKYTVFGGRAARPEFWWFTLINIIIAILIATLAGALLGRGGLVIYYLYDLAVLLPGLAVTFRRLHDTDKSGWWILISIVPIVGSIVLIVFLASAGTPGDNRYGPVPATQPA